MIALLLGACGDPAPEALPAPEEPAPPAPDPCSVVDHWDSHRELVCRIDLLDEATAALLGARPDREELTLVLHNRRPEALEALAQVPWARSILVASQHDDPPVDLALLAPLQELRRLRVNGRVSDVEGAWQLRQLRELSIREEGPIDVDGLEHVRELKRLSLGGERLDGDLSSIGALTSLEHLALGPVVADLSFLRSLTGLRTLSLQVTSDTDLTPLKALSSLDELSVRGARVDRLASALQQTPITRLFLARDPAVVDVSPLASLQRLRLLDLSETGATRIAPLARLEELRDLKLWETPVEDIPAVAELPALERVLLSPEVSSAERDEITSRRPDLTIR